MCADPSDARGPESLETEYRGRGRCSWCSSRLRGFSRRIADKAKPMP